MSGSATPGSAAPNAQALAEPTLARVSVWLERGPAALARVFGLLCTLQLVPLAATAATAEADAIRLDLAFDPAARDRLDLLLRKLAQLVECLELEHSPTS